MYNGMPIAELRTACERSPGLEVCPYQGKTLYVESNFETPYPGGDRRQAAYIMISSGGVLGNNEGEPRSAYKEQLVAAESEFKRHFDAYSSLRRRNIAGTPSLFWRTFPSLWLSKAPVPDDDDGGVMQVYAIHARLFIG